MKSALSSTLSILLLTAGAGLPASPALAQQSAVAPAASLNEAETLLLNMADTLGRADRFHVHIRTGYDAVQPSGQKVEFLEARDVLVKRPDKLRIETRDSRGVKSRLLFDGKTISVATEGENVYGQADKQGSIDDAVRYFRRDLGMRLPLAGMLLTTLRQELEQRMDSADYVETATLCDGKYHHIAARGEDLDMQVWISTKGPALPKRVVLTYKHADGQPQFWAEFSDWDLSPWSSNSKFDFDAPKGARKIPFLPQLNSITPAVPQ